MTKEQEQKLLEVFYNLQKRDTDSPVAKMAREGALVEIKEILEIE